MIAAHLLHPQVVDMPLLFETGTYKWTKPNVVVACSHENQASGTSQEPWWGWCGCWLADPPGCAFALGAPQHSAARSQEPSQWGASDKQQERCYWQSALPSSLQVRKHSKVLRKYRLSSARS